jgi:hypothetical protein
MLIVRSTCSCAPACCGDNARETRRPVPVADEGGWYPPDNEVANPNASEPVSASLHHWRAAILPNVVKPAIGGEATNAGIRQDARGDWGERATTEHARHPGEPLRSPVPTVGTGQGTQGSHNLRIPRRRQSGRLIVAVKRGNSRGAKGPDLRCVSTAKGGSA